MTLLLLRANTQAQVSKVLQVQANRALNEGSRRLNNHGEGLYWGHLLVESAYWQGNAAPECLFNIVY